jgi:hypothetical protein
MLSSSYQSWAICNNAIVLFYSLFAEMIGTLSVSADVHVFLYIYSVGLIKSIIDLFHEENFFPIKDI